MKDEARLELDTGFRNGLKTEVAIVGAGAGGLYAAYRLTADPANGNPLLDVNGNPVFQANGSSPSLSVHRSGFYRAAYLQDTWQASRQFIVNYGLRDLTHTNAASTNEREAYADHVRDTIRDFDPRLTDVEVTARFPEDVQRVQQNTFKVSALYFRVRATLRLGQNVAEPVVFDTMFDASRGRHIVSASEDGA